MSNERKSVYVLGAEDGMIMGPLMAVTIVLFGASTYVMWLSVPALLGALGVPILAYYLLAKSYKAAPATTSFSALWLQGICMFFFGGLVMAAIAYAAMRWAAPGFIMHQVNTIIEIYGSVNDPQAEAMVEAFEKLKSAGALPTPLDMTLEMLYAAVFSGSLLSMIYSWAIRRKGRQTPPPYNQNF